MYINVLFKQANNTYRHFNQCSSSNVMGSPYGGFMCKQLVVVGAEAASNGGGILSTARIMIRSIRRKPDLLSSILLISVYI